MVHGLGHTGIIHVAEIMPYPIFLVYPHVTHLDWKEVFQYRLPYTPVVNRFVDTEYGRERFAILDLVKTRLFYVGEIKAQIMVSQELSPGFRLFLHGQFLTIGSQAIELGLLDPVIPLVDLNDRFLRLVGMITHLRCLNNRLINPVLNDIGSN